MEGAARRQPEGGGSVGHRLPVEAFWNFPAPGTLNVAGGGGIISSHTFDAQGRKLRHWWD